MAQGPPWPSRLHEALGTQEDVVSRLQGLRPTRSRTYASATALPRSPQGSLPAWVGWPLTGRGSHPLDDTQGFMTYSSIPLDRPAWPHHAPTPLRARIGPRGRCRSSDALPALRRAHGSHGSRSRGSLEARPVLDLPGMRPPLLDHVYPAENGLCHPPAQWREGTLPSRRHLRRHGSECKPGL